MLQEDFWQCPSSAALSIFYTLYPKKLGQQMEEDKVKVWTKKHRKWNMKNNKENNHETAKQPDIKIQFQKT